jgi:hypothetical protein
MLSMDDLFKGQQFDREVTIFCIQWYLRFKLSFSKPYRPVARTGEKAANNVCGRLTVITDDVVEAARSTLVVNDT